MGSAQSNPQFSPARMHIPLCPLVRFLQPAQQPVKLPLLISADQGLHLCSGHGQTVKPEVKAEGAAGPSCSSAEGMPPRKKPKKAPPRVYEPCGRGPSCTCAICRKAREQQVGAMAGCSAPSPMDPKPNPWSLDLNWGWCAVQADCDLDQSSLIVLSCIQLLVGS